jgi:hypothetical protein
MATIWIHQVYVIGENAAMPGAIQALDIAFPCDDGQPRDPSKPELYGSKYSATGNLPATHYGSAFVITEPVRQNLESLGLHTTPGISYWRATNPEGILSTTNHLPDVAKAGQPWDWQQCLSSMGLQLVVIPRNQEV